MKWTCTVCGYTHEGPEAPAQCPQCKVPAEKFIEVKNKATKLIDAILSGKKIKQYDSLKINAGYQFSKFDGFVGRVAEMSAISSSFDKSNLLILQGEGGIGKTSLAKATSISSSIAEGK